MRRYALILLVAALTSAAAGRDAFDRWIDRTDLPVLLAETSVEVRDRHGALLRAYTVEDGIWRLSVAPAKVDPDFINMLVRYEDRRFWRHKGVDALAMIRALGQAIANRGAVSGGSTLTMQIARLLENSGTGNWTGKIRQIRVALALERRMPKEDILALYLLHAPYGGNLEGVRAASIAWFGKEPRRLTPAESALLVALPQAPEARRPDRNLAAARAARDRVLDRLAGSDALDAEAAESALATPVPSNQRPFARYAAHLADRVRSASPAQGRHDLTVDLRVQAALEILAARTAQSSEARVSTAILVADHQTGEIIASVGSPAYRATDGRQGFVDMTQAIRSPGSTLKPLIYGLAFDRGLAHPETMIADAPVRFGRYAPQNFDGMFRGDLRIREALQLSLNIPVVKLTSELGPARIMAALRRAGAAPRVPGGKAGLAISLGGVGLTLQELVQVYASLARGGTAIPLRWSLTEPAGAQTRLISDVAAWQVGHILAGLTPPPGAPMGALAYKTGTSYGHRDAWAIGWDGRHVIGVWIGRADGTPVPGAFGGDRAAPVLFEAFGRLKPAFDPLPAPPPATLLVSTSQLPQPLQRFRTRSAAFERSADAPQLTFPPNGAQLALEDGPLTVKLRGGQPPFSVLANGFPVLTGVHTREMQIDPPGPGFSTLVLVDASGQSDRVTINQK